MKRNKSVMQVAVAGAILAMSVGAQAGNIGETNQIYATEIFGGAAAVPIVTPATNYQFGATMTSSTPLYIYLTLSNGVLFNAAPSVANFVCKDSTGATVASADLATSLVGASGGTAASAVITINSSGMANGFDTNSICNYNETAANLNLPSTFATAGSTASVTWSISNTFSTTAVPAALIDTGGTHTGIIVTSETAISGVVKSSAVFATPETARINVANELEFISWSTNSNATVVNLGSVTFTNTPGTILDAAGNADYNLGTAAVFNAISFNGTVTGAFAAGTLIISSVSTCAAPTAIAANGTGVLSSNSKFTFTDATTPTTATPYYFCYTPGGVSDVDPTIPVATFQVTPIAATGIADSATGNFYQLQLNGVTREVRSYVPAAYGNGYNSFVRVINTTALPAPLYAQFANADGTFTPAAPTKLNFVINGAASSNSLPAGGSVTLSAAQIEASIGSPGAIDTGTSTGILGAARPRLIITAAVPESAAGSTNPGTSGVQTVEAQSFLFITGTNGSTFTDMTGAQ